MLLSISHFNALIVAAVAAVVTIPADKSAKAD
jgi:hypothetical protein